MLCILISSLAFGETVRDKQAEEIATTLGVVYVGMPKKALYEVYTKHQQKGYYKDGNEEWIAFSEWMTEEPGDKITFYLKDGKVKGWDK